MTTDSDSMFWGWGFWEWLGAGLLSLILTLVLTALILCARADGRADFCYVGSSRSVEGVPQRYWYAEAHRPWRPDMTLGYFATPEEAFAAVERAGCRLYTAAQ